LDTEWLLSTLFDASLLSTLKAAGNGGSFFGGVRGRQLRVGNHKYFFNFTLLDSRSRTRNDLFIISHPLRAGFEIIRVRR
jgi:hypothetical protein